MEEFKRMILKVSDIEGASATVPTSPDHTDGSWIATDIYEGELFLNTVDNIIQTRTESGIINLNSANTSDAERVVQNVRFDEQVSKGEPLRITGYNQGSGIISVAKADASASAEMPCYGLASEDYDSGATGTMVVSGNLSDINTSAFNEGDTLYVAVGGGLTSTKPIEPNLIQNVGFVARSNANNGTIEVVAIGRANDVPNLPVGHTFIGTSTNPTTIDLTTELNNKQDTLISGTNIKTINGSTILGSGDFVVSGGGKFVDGTNPANAVYTDGNVGIGTTTPSEALEVNGRISQIGLGNSVFVGQFSGQNDDLSNNENVGIGVRALRNNTIGAENTAIGYNSLQSNSTGNESTAVGKNSLYLSNGSGNTAVGESAMFSNTVGQSNCAFGKNSLLGNQTGNYNLAAGYQSLASGNKGSYNVALGYNAMFYSSATSSNNITLGRDSGVNLNGSNNTFAGNYSGKGVSNVSNSVFIGSGSGQNSSGNACTSVGFNSGQNNTGLNQVAIGSSAGFGNSGNHQIALGTFAGLNNNGEHNVNIGNMAGMLTADNSNNLDTQRSIFIGRNTKSNTPNDTNEIVIGDQAIGNGSNSVTLGNDSITLTVLKGIIKMTGVPNSPLGLDVGSVWQDGGTLKIVI